MWAWFWWLYKFSSTHSFFFPWRVELSWSSALSNPCVRKARASSVGSARVSVFRPFRGPMTRRTSQSRQLTCPQSWKLIIGISWPVVGVSNHSEPPTRPTGPLKLDAGQGLIGRLYVAVVWIVAVYLLALTLQQPQWVFLYWLESSPVSFRCSSRLLMKTGAQSCVCFERLLQVFVLCAIFGGC